jgi:hypothetical protein
MVRSRGAVLHTTAAPAGWTVVVAVAPLEQRMRAVLRKWADPTYDGHTNTWRTTALWMLSVPIAQADVQAFASALLSAADACRSLPLMRSQAGYVAVARSRLGSRVVLYDAALSQMREALVSLGAVPAEAPPIGCDHVSGEAARGLVERLSSELVRRLVDAYWPDDVALFGGVYDAVPAHVLL